MLVVVSIALSFFRHQQRAFAIVMREEITTPANHDVENGISQVKK